MARRSAARSGRCVPAFQKGLKILGQKVLDRAKSLLYKAPIPSADGPHGWLRQAPFGDAQVAQLVEHATENRSVGGSIPSLGTISPHRSMFLKSAAPQLAGFAERGELAVAFDLVPVRQCRSLLPGQVHTMRQWEMRRYPRHLALALYKYRFPVTTFFSGTVRHISNEINRSPALGRMILAARSLQPSQPINCARSRRSRHRWRRLAPCRRPLCQSGFGRGATDRRSNPSPDRPRRSRRS